MAGLGTPFVSETVASTPGLVQGPTAGTTLVSIPSTSLPAGYWLVRLVGGAEGTATAAPQWNNINFMRGASVYARLLNMRTFMAEESLWQVILDGTQSLSLQVIANEDPGIYYNAAIRATRIA
jgi:hypothetical protein